MREELTKELLSMLVWLASYPRSGNTYFRLLLNYYYGIHTYSLYQDDEFAEQPEVQKLVGPLPKKESLAAMSQATEVYFVKTHELPPDNSPGIYLVRDGRDVLLSYAWYILTIEYPETHPQPALFWKTLHALIIDQGYFGGWGSHVLSWTQRRVPTVIIKFEDLVRSSDPLHIVKQALNRINKQSFKEVTTTLPPTFSKLHQYMPKFFRKGQIENWRTGMPPKLHELFWQQHGEAMREMGYGTSSSDNQFTTVEQRIFSEEREKDITEWSHIAEHRLQRISQYNDELTITEKLIRIQREELEAKEKVIQELHITIKQMESQPLPLVLKRFLPRYVQQSIRRVRQKLQPQLGQLEQYRPIPPNLAEHYVTPRLSREQTWPVISIVTPSLNQAQFLERTLQSVLEQHYPNLEYLVQDGGSTDDTPEILEKYRSHLASMESCQDRGQANALNRGFARTTGEIMAWLNSDDVLLPGTLAYVAQFFQEHPDVDVVYGHRIVVNEDDQEIGRWILPPHDPRMLRWADYIPQETLFWRRRIWEKAGGYLDESFDFALDWELLLRFCDAGATFRRVPRFLAAFRVHAEQKTSRHLNDLGLQEMGRLRKHMHGREISNQEALARLRVYMFKHLLYNWLYRWKLLRL